MFPFGFPAVLTSISDRVRADDGAAFLRKRQFITVRIPTLTYGGVPDAQPLDGRNLPFKAVETTTLVTPPLVAAREPLGAGDWVQVADANGAPSDLRFKLILTGWDGNKVTADLPLVFILKANNPSTLAGVGATVTAYNLVTAHRRTVGLHGQKLAFVPTPTGATEDPSLPTFDVVLQAEPATTDTPEALAAFPKMLNAGVRIEVLDAVNPQAAGLQALVAPPPTTIILDNVYTANGLGGAANKNEVWAKITDAETPALGVPQQLGGGMAAPSLKVQGLSMVHGPIADIAKLADPAANFDPSSYFDLGVTLLGGIKLSDVVPSIPFPDPRNGADKDAVPKVVTTKTATAIDTVITWRPKLQPVLVFQPGAAENATEEDKRLDLTAVFHTDIATGATTSKVTGELRNFALTFVEKEPSSLAFIRQEVKKLRFESANGAKPSLDVQLGKSEFLGQLKFLIKLQELIPALPGGVKIDVDALGHQRQPVRRDPHRRHRRPAHREPRHRRGARDPVHRRTDNARIRCQHA